MKILIVISGAQNDTQPIVALASALRKAGHECVLFSPHAKLSLDGQPIAADGWDRNNYGGNAVLTWANPQQVLGKLWEECERVKPELLLSTQPIPFLGICEKLRIPFVQVQLQPMAPSKDFPPVLVNDGLPLRWFPSWHRWLGQSLYPAMYRRDYRRMKPQAFHRDIGLTPQTSPEVYYHMFECMPTLVAAPEQLLPRPRDYPKHQVWTGFWFMDGKSDDFQPAPELVSFLDGATRPIVSCGFGSMEFEDSMSVALSRAVLSALRKADVLGILLGGSAGLSRERLGDRAGDEELKAWAVRNVMELDRASYTWLFPRVAACCHHGGDGTLAAALRAGKPSVVCPWRAGQSYWGTMVETREMGLKGPNLSTITASTLAPLLLQVVTDENIQLKARNAGQAIVSRDSLKEAVHTIECFAETFPYPWHVNCQPQGQAEEKKRRRQWPYNSKQDSVGWLCCWCWCLCSIKELPGFERHLYKEVGALPDLDAKW